LKAKKESELRVVVSAAPLLSETKIDGYAMKRIQEVLHLAQ